MNLETPQQPEKGYHGHSIGELEYFRDHSNIPISQEDLEKLCEGNEILESLYHKMIEYCVRYAEDVFNLEELDETSMSSRDENWKSEREGADRLRRDLHEATIDSINILSRNLKEQGRSNEWLRPIATGGRSAYSRFAIALAFSYYLSLRKKEEHEQDQ